MRVMARSVLLCGLLGVSVAMLSAGSPDQQPTGAQVVVRAMTDDGRPVLDLTAADVTVRVDGRERAVKALDLVRPTPTAASTAVAPAAATPPALPAPYATNAATAMASGASREFLVAIDDEGIAPGRDAVVREAVQTLASRLAPSDAVGVASMRRGGLSLAPTLDRSASSEMLGRIVAAGSSRESVNDFGCRTKAVLTRLSSILQGAPANDPAVLIGSDPSDRRPDSRVAGEAEGRRRSRVPGEAA
jgi:hypothetical protein